MNAGRVLAIAAAFAMTPSVAFAAAGETVHAFVAHAAAFSLDEHQPELVDPQVFIGAAGASAGAGVQGIVHRAGFRPALMMDDPASQACTAVGKPLGMTLGAWLGARGTLVLDMSLPFSPRIRATFNGLVPGGLYSLFEVNSGDPHQVLLPLDGFGTRNTFSADPRGSGDFTVTLRHALTRATAVLLVYHSDGVEHGALPGRPGIDAHEQLMYRPL